MPIEGIQVSDNFYWIVYPSHSHISYKPEEIRSVLISRGREEIKRLNADLRQFKQNFDRGLLVQSVVVIKSLFERFGKRDQTTLL